MFIQKILLFFCFIIFAIGMWFIRNIEILNLEVTDIGIIAGWIVTFNLLWKINIEVRDEK